MSTSSIEHSGYISEFNDSTIFVKIISTSACLSCHAKGMCSSSEMEEKIIEVENNQNSHHNIGDIVTIVMNPSLGTKAVLLGYFYPFLIVIISFIITMQLTENQGIIGLVSLASLLPYYIIISLYRKNHKQNFKFHLKE